MHKIEELKKMKERFMCALCQQMDAGLENLDTKEAGDVVDMIKDLAEAEAKCMEAKYYQSVICAMEEAGENGMDPEDMEMMWQGMAMDNMRRGYNPNRSSRTGRYTSNRGGQNGNSMRSSGNGNSSRGYPYYPDNEPHTPEYDDHNDGPMERFGRPYNEYRKFRRNYTETKSREDKMEMDRHAKEHIDDAVSTMQDIWNSSDPELKKKMKQDLTNLLSKMN